MSSALLFLASGLAHGAVHYIDPINGDIDNDGSYEHPWSTLQEVFEHNKIESYAPQNHPYSFGDPLVVKNQGAPVKAGDTIMLLGGYHGRIFAAEYYNSDYITIEALDGHTPTAANLELRSVCKWIVRGLTISPSFADVFERKTLLQFANHGWTGPSYDCVVERCTLYTAWDTSSWTSDDWNEKESPTTRTALSARTASCATISPRISVFQASACSKTTISRSTSIRPITTISSSTMPAEICASRPVVRPSTPEVRI